ncbi:MAG: N-acetylmuramoyl-L-alanine amidase [Proteobacteria bacterium]|nr:N-acetylmuramoyl-L-alanine amidase [Pseudomonadota bacterium]
MKYEIRKISEYHMFYSRKFCFLCLVAVVMLLVTLPEMSVAQTAKDKYFDAEACYQKLQNSTKRQIYRDQWLACIDKFESVYRQDPSGPWAAAGLHMSGVLYQELYRRSGKLSDKKEALDIFERIVKRFPRSRYRKKAADAINAFSKEKKSEITVSKAPASRADPAKDKYFDAEACYQKLQNSTKRQKYRDQWLACIDKFESVCRYDPSGPWAAVGLYMSGVMYQELYRRSFKLSDKKEARAIFERIIEKYPRSRYRKKAADAIRASSSSISPRLESATPWPQNNDQAKAVDEIAAQIEKAAADAAPVDPKDSVPEGQNVTVKGLRFWSNPSYTRIVIDADSETAFTHRLLNQDSSIQKPQRLYIDLTNSRLSSDIEKIIPINDNLLIGARAGQFAADSVRVVVDIKSFETYKIFSLKNPFRIVVDVWGTQSKPTRPAIEIEQKDVKLAPGALAKQLALGVSRIVIDPGHGGRDYGAPGHLKYVHEKNIALKIAQRLAQKIRKELNCEVFLTRNSDRHLTLEERTAIANTKNADLFISIHTNAARDKRAYGIETFFLNLATDDDAIMVAARENATSTKNISDLQAILSDLMQNAKLNESSRLAVHVQAALHQHLGRHYSQIKSKGVKQAPFYVLLGAQMPAILIETSFISNLRECKRLINTKYQDQMCDAIVNGIEEYIKEINPTALFKSSPRQGSKG